jgi:metallophosphoesterase (TIGR00282 family)
VRILMIGDIVGRPGRRAVAHLLPGLRRDLKLDFVVANGENAAAGFGITGDTAQEILDAGVDVITSGDHIWDQKEIVEYLDSGMPLLRPHNYPPGAPGKGYLRVGRVAVINLLGRVFMQPVDDPFRTADALVAQAQADGAKVIVVDFHAEATSEKQGLGWYLDGRVSAVAGTHTHVPTADPRVLPRGTGFVTDLGFAGATNSIIGNDVTVAIERLTTLTPRRLTQPSGPATLNAVLFDVAHGGKATAVHRVDRFLE